MKIRILLILVAIVFVISLNGCVVTTWNDDILFECKSINNTQNNIKSGGNIAYVKHKLYISFDNTLYEVYNGKRNPIDTTTLNVDDNPYGAVAHYFNYNDELYAIPVSDNIHTLMKYDSEKEEFIDSHMQINPHYGGLYMSDNLCVWKGHNWNDMYLRYNKEEYIVDNKTDCFSVYDDVVYYTTNDGKLYSFDPQEVSNKSNYITKLDNSYVHEIYVIKDKCYYLCDNNTYCYSFSDNKRELVTDYSVNNFNVFDDRLFLSTENNGIYYVEGNQMNKISNISATCIYSVDDEYLYAYNIDGNTYRIKIDNCQVEPIVETK